MKKTIHGIVGFAALLALVAVPTFTGATNTSTIDDLKATLQQQMEALKSQLATLTAQWQALQQTQSGIKDTTQDIKGALQLIRQLKLGTSGEDVKTLQQFLATDPSIYPEGLITGYFGKLTEKAVAKLQTKLCVSQVGQVGPTTLRRINELLTEGAGKSGKVPPGLLKAPGILKKLCGNATTTPDTTAPVISNIMATSTTATTTVITWTTDESANSKVWYGTATPVNTTATTTLQVSSSDHLLAHEILLSGLTANTTYYYVVSSADKSGNTTNSVQASFITLGQ